MPASPMARPCHGHARLCAAVVVAAAALVAAAAVQRSVAAATTDYNWHVDEFVPCDGTSVLAALRWQSNTSSTAQASAARCTACGFTFLHNVHVE